MPPSASGSVETDSDRDARMAWWREARFGMFIHWGIYSGLAGNWEGKPVTSGGTDWIQSLVKADTDTYAEAALSKFQPGPEFAREWAKLAANAGCRYVVVTTKHHDGFSLSASKFGDFNAGAKLNRDLLKEIVEAFRAAGLRVGFYHSLIDWHHDQYAYLKSQELPHPLAGQPYPDGTRDHSEYIEYLHDQIEELLSNYGKVDVLWWDFSSQDFQGDEAWRATDLMKLARSKQPGIIMNNRLFRSLEAGWVGMGTPGEACRMDHQYGDFSTPEQEIPAAGMPRMDWESCMTLNNSWGYNEHDHDWKPDGRLVRNLVEAASKGGNLLLNIGPKADGSLTPETVRSFEAIGSWMKTNSESIYGTQPGPFEKAPWGRCTMKQTDSGAVLYLHVFEWPADRKLLLPGLENEVKSAQMLTGQEILKFKKTLNGVVLDLPPRAPDTNVPVIKVVVAAEPKFAGAGRG